MVHLLQDQILELQNKKDLLRRQRNQERAIRFMDAKTRTIGIDKDFLDQQIHEKELQRKQEEDDIFNYAENEKGLCQYLNERDHMMSCVRTLEAQDVKETLLQQMLQPKNNAVAKGTPLNIDECTAASLQKFVGEDLSYHNRKKMQQEQLKEWCEQTIQERNITKHLEAMTESDFAQQLLHQDSLNILCAQRKEQFHRDLRKSIQQENVKLHQEKKLVQEHEVNFSEKVGAPLLSECTNEATLYDYKTQKIRPDHFKGFSKEALSHILEENDAVVRSKQLNQMMEKRKEDEWIQYQKDLCRKQEIDSIMQQQNRIKEKTDVAFTLEQQKMEQKMRQDFHQSNRFGQIESVFFESFGTSCR